MIAYTQLPWTFEGTVSNLVELWIERDVSGGDRVAPEREPDLQRSTEISPVPWQLGQVCSPRPSQREQVM